ncbi:helix-turn-helix transcriptional regulator [Roseisolibacter agri]|uniref:LuxR family transcriptional regulator n=1 Tax=Roseisolibacter agri TaxID=2014610 RepID=A0AA37Q8I3_9BACT|nr:helix-turn-helix transcriptional regulator [Roseisolibacter agri]GLC28535.1 LuxR family transcriptional regulator [Roseisolibacter agri]
MRIALTPVETARLGDVLSLLLSPPLHQDADCWRAELARLLRTLIGAPMAALTVETADGARTYGDEVDPRAVRAYEHRFRALDLGRHRLRALGLELWSRERLWSHAQLQQSEYYNDFARPYALHDAVGLAVELRSARTHVMASLLHDQPVRSPTQRERQLALLGLVRPAFRAGMVAHLRDATGPLAACRDPRAGLIDAADEPQALYSRDGELLYRNRAMAAALDDGHRGALRHAVFEAVRAALATAADAPDAPRAATRAVRTATATYRVRAGVVVSDADGRGSSVLVSLRRHEAATATADELRARFGLTGREAQVAVLLLQRRSNAEIAEALELSEHTARHHTERVLHKLGVKSRMALADALTAPR